jgi:RNA polymerase sigma-70 factor (ECF subfamily)
MLQSVGESTALDASGTALADLLARARRRDRDAFAELYRLSVRPVFRYVAARVRTVEEAEEVTQEVFLAALSGIHSLRATTEPALFAWLFQIARFKLADRLRGQYRRPARPLDASMDPADPAPSVEDVLSDVSAREEQRERVRIAMAELTDDQREVVTCKYVLGYTNEQTAAQIGKNVNAVNQLHHRALRSLQRLLGAGEPAR